MVITEPTNRLFTDPFFPRLLRGISGRLSAQGLQLVLLMPESRDEESSLERYLVRGHVDGVVLVSLHGSDPLPAHLVAGGIPIVIGGRPPAGVAASYVDVDNREGARTAVRHLADQGRRRIATIAGPQDMAPGIDRLKGYRDGLADVSLAHDPTLVTASDFTSEGGAEAMRRLLEARPDLDAVFAASDFIAAGALSVLRAAGRTVPGRRRRGRLRRLAAGRGGRPAADERAPADRGDGRRARPTARGMHRGPATSRAARPPFDGADTAWIERREALALIRPAAGRHLREERTPHPMLTSQGG